MKAYYLALALGAFSMVSWGCGKIADQQNLSRQSADLGQGHEKDRSATAADPPPDAVKEPPLPGFGDELSREVRLLIAAHVRQQSNVTNIAEQAAKIAADYAKSLQRLANEFAVKTDRSGQIDWLSLIQNEAKLRKELEAPQYFDLQPVALPEWASPLIREQKAGKLNSTRKELLLRLTIVGSVMQGK